MNPQVLETIKTLPVAERIQLIEDLWDSIALPQADFALSEAQEVELDHRLTALEQNRSCLRPWSEVAAKILSGR